MQLLTTAVKFSLLPSSSSSGYYFEDTSAKNAVLDPLNSSSTSLTLKMQRVRAQQTLTASPSMRLCPLVLLLLITFHHLLLRRQVVNLELTVIPVLAPASFYHHNWNLSSQ